MGTAGIEREVERRRRHIFPGDERRDEGLKTIAGGAVSFAPPPTPKPSTTSRTGRGGVQTCIWDSGSGKQKRTLVGQSRRVGSFPTDGRWGTDDGGDQTLEAVGEIHRNGRRGGIWEEKREETGKMLLKEQGSRMNLGGGGKEGTTSSSTGKHRHLILRGQSLGIVQADVRGSGTNHPIMDKLGVPEARPTDRQIHPNALKF